jgi:hypothetical protein
VGIGEDVPEGKLHIFTGDASVGPNAQADELVVEGSGHTGISILSGNDDKGNIYFGDSGDDDIGSITYHHDGNTFRLTANASEVMRIGNGGRVSTNVTTLNHGLHINNGNGSNYVTVLTNTTDTNPYGLKVEFSGAAPDDTTRQFIVCADTSATRFIVLSDGDVQNHDNSYSGTSDEKLKEQITDASSQWDDIKALKIRKFKMKEDVAKGDSDAHWRLGVVAQEVEAAGMNGLVKNNPDLSENKDGELTETGTVTKSVKYSILYMKAVKALQEAMTRIETLETKVKALEG